MLTKLSAALAAICLLSGASLAQEGAKPTDPQIAMIAVTAGNVDVDAGKLAAEKSTNPKVKAFAQMMVRDHTSVNKKATALVKKLNVTPEESDTSRSLKSDGDKNLEKLRGLSGAGIKSKVLMTTRLCPRVLESADGKSYYSLYPLRPGIWASSALSRTTNFSGVTISS